MIKMTQKITALMIMLFVLSYPALAGSGTFIGVEGESVNGTATISGNTVKLSSNFTTTRGPDLYVYLGNNKPTKIVAKLRRVSGAQTYTIPAGTNASQFKKVFIHCKRFNHTFGVARVR